ncbi:MAG: DNA replication/repair protein RecF [Patescibacteria group bacterium]|nr:DNA replication/repair protein RecF [Patescibacteria group bacterium]
MKIRKLKLENWRNHASFEFEFNSITIIVGPNACGKTNFLEAIYYLACGRSFRSKDINLIKWGTSYLRVTGDLEKASGNEDLLVVVENQERMVKTVKIKGQKKPSSQLLGHINCVLFTPEEIELISTLPEARRRYLNLIISQTDREYAYSLTHYKKTLEHRNSLLRRIGKGLANEKELEIWDGKLAEFGNYLIVKRQEYIEKINITLPIQYQALSGKKDDLIINYLPSIKSQGGWAELISQITKNRTRDIYSGVTTIGPHRDDIEFLLNGKNINEFASRGEFRTVILALKLAEIDYFTKITGEKPVLLLDDVFSELDESRRDLLSQIFKKQQTIVTTTDLDHVSKNIIKESKVVKI